MTSPVGAQVEHSPRGFKRFPPIEGMYVGTVQVYESSAASAPHLWVRVVCPENLDDATVHLTHESATLLRDQLTYLLDHHYQMEG